MGAEAASRKITPVQIREGMHVTDSLTHLSGDVVAIHVRSEQQLKDVALSDGSGFTVYLDPDKGLPRTITTP